MSTGTELRTKSNKWRTSTTIILVLSLLVAACGGGAQIDNETAVADALRYDSLEYGDSLEDWSDNLGTPEPELEILPGYSGIAWEDLVPPGYSGDEIYARYADRLAALDDFSEEADAIYEEMQAEYDGDAINADMDGNKVQLAGFVAPLNYDDEIINEFFLVPYFGACIHVPPPPPNQTILVTLDKEDGLTIEESYGSVWVAGTLEATSTEADIGTSNYSITADSSGIHELY